MLNTAPDRLPHDDAALLTALASTQALARYDLRGSLLWASPAFLQLMGYTAEEIVGAHHSHFVPLGLTQSAGYDRFWQRLVEGLGQSGEFRRITRDGRYLALQGSYTPVRDAAGRVRAVVAYYPDAAQAMARQAQLATAQAGLDALAADGFSYEVDDQGRYLSVDAGLERVLRCKAQFLIGQTEWLLRDGCDTDPWPQLRAGETVSEEQPCRSADGSRRWLSLVHSPVRDAQGVLQRVFVSGRDITAEKFDRLDAMGQLAAIDRSQAVVEFDLQGHVLDANANFLQLFGYSLDEVRGQQHALFVDAAGGAAGHEPDFWAALALGRAASGEFLRVAKDGRRLWIQGSYAPVMGPQGRALRVVKVATDVTAEKLRKAEFEAQTRALDRSHLVVEFGLDGRVLTANANFLAATGYSSRDIVGRHHALFCSDDYRRGEEYRDFWLRLGEGQAISGRFHRLGRHGRDLWIQATYSPVFDLQGRVAKVVKYAHDVTREVRLEQRIAALSGQMQTTAQQLLGSLDLIASRAGICVATAQQARLCAELGLAAMQRALRAIQLMQDNSARVQALVERIAGIAAESHALALNAAIEAARSGADGRSFAVVALAVRELADRSEEAAAQTLQLIEESSARVSSGATLAQTVNAGLAEVLERASTTGDSVQAIARATVEQRELAQRFDASLQALAFQATT